jgi:hypothetical protein
VLSEQLIFRRLAVWDDFEAAACELTIARSESGHLVFGEGLHDRGS